MTHATNSPWIKLKPSLSSKASKGDYLKHARALAAVHGHEFAAEVIEKARARFVTDAKTLRRSDRQALLAAGLVISDLATQDGLFEFAVAASRSGRQNRSRTLLPRRRASVNRSWSSETRNSDNRLFDIFWTRWSANG